MSRVEFHNPTPEWRTSNLLIDLRRLPQKTRARLDVKGLAQASHKQIPQGGTSESHR